MKDVDLAKLKLTEELFAHEIEVCNTLSFDMFIDHTYVYIDKIFRALENNAELVAEGT